MDANSEETIVLEQGLGEAQQTVDRQMNTMGVLDGKALQVLQLNTAIIGFIFTALTFLNTSPEFELTGFFNVFAQAGLLFLVASIALSLLTYTVRQVQPGLSSESLRSLESKAKQSNAERRYYRAILTSYANAIDANTTTIRQKSRLSQVSLLTNVYGVTLLSISVVQGLYNRISLVFLVLIGGILIAITIAVVFPPLLTQLWSRFFSSNPRE